MLVVAAPLVGSTATTVLTLVAALLVVGVAMICVTVWLVRSTRTDSVSLGPLEVMGDRRFRRAGSDGRAGRLAAARSAGALSPAPIVPFEDAPIDMAAADEPEMLQEPPTSAGGSAAALQEPPAFGAEAVEEPASATSDGESTARAIVPTSGRDPSLGVISPDPRDESRPDAHPPAQLQDPVAMPDPAQIKEPGEQAG